MMIKALFVMIVLSNHHAARWFAKFERRLA
jgi:hypothetical protein